MLVVGRFNLVLGVGLFGALLLTSQLKLVGRACSFNNTFREFQWWRTHPVDDGIKHLLDVRAVLRRDEYDLFLLKVELFLDLLDGRRHIGCL